MEDGGWRMEDGRGSKAGEGYWDRFGVKRRGVWDKMAHIPVSRASVRGSMTVIRNSERFVRVSMRGGSQFNDADSRSNGVVSLSNDAGSRSNEG